MGGGRGAGAGGAAGPARSINSTRVGSKVRVVEEQVAGRISLGAASPGSCCSSRGKGRKSRARDSRGRADGGGEVGMDVGGFTREGGEATRGPGVTIEGGAVADVLAAGLPLYITV